MKLNTAGLREKNKWEQAGYRLPQYDREEMITKTKAAPFWIHFGAGNIFRAFQANVVQNLLNQGVLDKGLIVAEGYDYEIITRMNRPNDNYSILATLKANGSVIKTVVGSIAEALLLDSTNTQQFSRLKEIFSMDSLQMVSFTITEKGYSLTGGDGELLPVVKEDFNNGPERPMSYIGKVTALLYERYLKGQQPIAMVSMDNCSHNGTKLYDAVTEFARSWVAKGHIDSEFEAYLMDEKKVSFPWTMIDKITPRPDPSVETILVKDGVEEMAPIVTKLNTYVAPFVNAEQSEYLVIEDKFPNGRPRLEAGGVIFTDRLTVDKVEKMKVCTCLNPLHTALAVFGCLLGYDLISDEMKDESLRKLVNGIGYTEGLPVVVNPGIIDPEEFIDTVINERIPNPFMPDTSQRIATDTSQKLAIRFGETIKAYSQSKELSVSNLKLIPLVFAGWIRYLMGIDDKGNQFKLSPDPMLNTLKPYIRKLRMGETGDIEETIRPIIENETIFGVNLYDFNLADLVCGYLGEMMRHHGAVRETLEKYV